MHKGHTQPFLWIAAAANEENAVAAAIFIVLACTSPHPHPPLSLQCAGISSTTLLSFMCRKYFTAWSFSNKTTFEYFSFFFNLKKEKTDNKKTTVFSIEIMIHHWHYFFSPLFHWYFLLKLNPEALAVPILGWSLKQAAFFVFSPTSLPAYAFYISIFFFNYQVPSLGVSVYTHPLSYMVKG